MGTRFLAQRLDCLYCLCLQARSENGFVPVPIIFGYRRGFGTVRPARMEFLVGTPSFVMGQYGTDTIKRLPCTYLPRVSSSCRPSSCEHVRFLTFSQVLPSSL